MAINRAALATLEIGGGFAPRRGIRVRTGSVGGGGAFGPEPDVDVVGGPFGGIDTAAGAVEAVAVRRGAAAVDAATFVGEAGVSGEGATVGGVHGHDVVGLVVDAFEDVDFAVGGPVGILAFGFGWCCGLLTKWEGQASKTRARYRTRYQACERGPGRPGRAGRSCWWTHGCCYGPGLKQRWSSQHAC